MTNKEGKEINRQAFQRMVEALRYLSDRAIVDITNSIGYHRLDGYENATYEEKFCAVLDKYFPFNTIPHNISDRDIRVVWKSEAESNTPFLSNAIEKAMEKYLKELKAGLEGKEEVEDKTERVTLQESLPLTNTPYLDADFRPVMAEDPNVEKPVTDLKEYLNPTPMVGLEEEDLVNKPNHYHKGDIDVIQALQAQMTKEEYEGFMKGNVAKYVFRELWKGGAQDLEKARFYLDRVIESKKGVKYVPEHQKAKSKSLTLEEALKENERLQKELLEIQEHYEELEVAYSRLAREGK
ncbi:hypothetical protein 031MP004_73 [Bacillus phage 031MP004]|nr:hypothetical protein 031MP004_73 [Bacillus phage 031MP004]